MISLIMLTFNRENTVRESLRHNKAHAGADWTEVIHCDNGSEDSVREVVEEELHPDVRIYNRENLGVAKGYNRAMAMATKEWVLITGCDRKLPENWLKTLLEHITVIPNTGVISIYAHPMDKCPERARGIEEVINGKLIQKAMPMGARIMRRELLKDAGYMHEGFGLYGWEDVVWGHSVENVCYRKGLESYIIPGLYSQHLGDTGISETHTGYDPHDYWKFKQKEVKEAYKQELMKSLCAQGYPPYRPY